MKVFGDKSERRGLKSKAAKFIGVHSTLVSQVLHGKLTINLEQAEKMSRFLGHNEEESHFFLLMVQKARAGTKNLENYFQNQLNQIMKTRQVIKKRVGKTDSIAAEDELRYYSSWKFSAIHVALSIPDLNNAAALANHLDIPIAQVRAMLDFLTQTGLAVSKELGNFEIGPKHIHLSSESAQVRNHHMNWRMRVLKSLDKETRSNLHYSSAVSLSTADTEKIKELLIQNLNSMNKVIQTSKEEQVYGLNFDFFNLN
ncbi:MAG: TIGR02147 family protein [Bdellovibrionaceae bacterium]|nr:TIGR02147 family protein [Pseudobdellovibrionaceae bacterium]